MEEVSKRSRTPVFPSLTEGFVVSITQGRASDIFDDIFAVLSIIASGAGIRCLSLSGSGSASKRDVTYEARCDFLHGHRVHALLLNTDKLATFLS